MELVLDPPTVDELRLRGAARRRPFDCGTDHGNARSPRTAAGRRRPGRPPRASAPRPVAWRNSGDSGSARPRSPRRRARPRDRRDRSLPRAHSGTPRARRSSRPVASVAPEGTSARTSTREGRAALEPLPRVLRQAAPRPLQPSARGSPGSTRSASGGSSFVWFTMVADGVGPSMQFDPVTTSWTVMASEY